MLNFYGFALVHLIRLSLKYFDVKIMENQCKVPFLAVRDLHDIKIFVL